MFPISLDLFQSASSEVIGNQIQEGDADFSDVLLSAIDQETVAPNNPAQPRILSGLQQLLDFLAQDIDGETSNVEIGQTEATDPPEFAEPPEFADVLGSSDQPGDTEVHAANGNIRAAGPRAAGPPVAGPPVFGPPVATVGPDRTTGGRAREALGTASASGTNPSLDPTTTIRHADTDIPLGNPAARFSTGADPSWNRIDRSASAQGGSTEPSAPSGDSVEPSARPVDIAKPAAPSGDSVEPSARPGDIAKPAAPSGDSVEPSARPGDLARPAAQSADFAEPASPSSAFAEPVAQSIGFAEPHTPSSTFAEPVAQSVDFAEPYAPSIDLGEPSAQATVHAIDGAKANVDHVDRSIEKLHPTLQTRVARVIERMKSEHGHEVKLVEGHRTPERQDHLYAQGRTRPGPVVTWTRDSRHAQGQAADLRIDGDSIDPSAYKSLQRIAREEGLHTLGMKDPGHVELIEQAEPLAEMERNSGGIARVARVARVAQVAQPLPARPGVIPMQSYGNSSVPASDPLFFGDVPVMDTAVPSGVGPRLQGASATADASGSGSTVARDASEPARTFMNSARFSLGGQASSDGSGSSPKDQSSGSSSTRVAEAPSSTGRPESPETPGFSTEVSASFARGEATPASAVNGRPSVDSMFQVERILEVKEAQSALSPQRVAVRLNGLQGPVDAIRVGLLDGTVDANLEPVDQVGARQLRTHVADLFRALNGHGLQLGSLSMDTGVGRTDLMGDPWMSLRSDPTSDVLKALLSGDPSGSFQDSDARDKSNPRGRQRSADPNPEQSRDQTNDEEDNR